MNLEKKTEIKNKNYLLLSYWISNIIQNFAENRFLQLQN